MYQYLPSREEKRFSMIHVLQSPRAISIPFALMVAALTFAASADGGEIRLKNGTVLTGTLWLQDTLTGTPVGMGKFLVPKDVDPKPRNIVMVDNGFFTAAAIAFDARELKAFTDLDDVRPHRYFFVPREELREWYP